MKRNSTFPGNRIILALIVLTGLFAAETSKAQTTLIMGNPITTIYGLTSNGIIYEISTSNASISRTIKDNSYTGNSVSNANGLAYNTFNGKFYYFKRNVGSSPVEFVSFAPATNTVTVLTTTTTCTNEVHTGCMSYDGKYYFTIDTDGNLNRYDIAANSWLKITSNIVDQFNNDVDAVVRSQSSGDIAIDGYGTIWMVTSSNSNYGIYKFTPPTGAVAKLTVTQVIAPTAATPSGNSFAGIAFNSNGQIFMGTRGDDKLYLLQNATTLKYIGKFGSSDAGNDLTSLNFPSASLLPVKWIDFNASLENKNTVSLDWKVTEENNSGFYIQHSADAANWETITFINSKGNTESAVSYAWSYNANLSGKQYYRIKQVDLDGKESYTAVKIINFASENKTATAVWPNPTRNTINIDNSATSTTASASFYDLSGKLALQKQLQKGINTVDISSLPAGNYIAKVSSTNGNSFTQKIIKL